MLRLLASAVNSDTPVLPSDNVDWSALLKLAEYHSVAETASYAVTQLPSDNRPEASVYDMFRQYQGLALVSESNISFETERILRLLSDAGVRVLPVKGYVIKNDYPVPAMRSMTDVDIIYDIDKKQQVRDILCAHGYTLNEAGKELDFTKEPFYHYEFHGDAKDSGGVSHTYFRDILSRASYHENSLAGSLSAEDSYLFILMHLAKHMRSGGAGIRMIMDVYVYNRAHRSDFDMEYLNAELDKLGLADFEEKVRRLSYNWFSADTPDTDSLLADYILCSCTFGVTRDSFLQSAMRAQAQTGKKQTPVHTFVRKIFPPYSSMSELYPTLQKHRILYPFCVISYWCNRIFKKRNVNTSNLKHYMASTDSDDAQRLRCVMEELGLKYN